jgi:O-antigen ligase
VGSNFINGIGSAGFENAGESGEIPGGNFDGHSILIDTLVRFGFISFLAVVLMLIMSILLCWDAKSLDGSRSFAVLVTFLAGALTYTIIGWSYFGVQLIPWLIALFLANGAISEKLRVSQHENLKETRI